MRKVLLTGVVALLLATGTAHAEAVWSNPWEEADEPDRIYFLLRTVACGLGKDVQRFAIWPPYDLAAKKTLDFYRVTYQHHDKSNGPHLDRCRCRRRHLSCTVVARGSDNHCRGSVDSGWLSARL